MGMPTHWVYVGIAIFVVVSTMVSAETKGFETCDATYRGRGGHG